MNLGMRTARVVNVKRFPVNFPAQFCPSGFGPPGGPILIAKMEPPVEIR